MKNLFSSKAVVYGCLCALLLSASCSKISENVISPTASSSSTNTPSDVLNYIRRLGFKDSAIQEQKDYYVVDGDMLFRKTMQVPAVTQQGARQVYTSYLVDFSRQADIKVYIDNSMTIGTDMTSEINSAVSQWSVMNEYGSRIRFRIVTAAPYDIVVASAASSFLGDSVCGGAEIANHGQAGYWCLINKNFLISSNYSYDQRQRTIAHELGHTIGLMHTNAVALGEPASGNDYFGNPAVRTDVPGVSGTDANSLMNGNQCGVGAINLSANDKAAVAVLYPNDRPYNLYYSYSYPLTLTWHAPLYVAAGSVVSYDVQYTAYPYPSSPVSGSATTTGTSYTFPFSQGQYYGASLVTNVRANYSNGYVSDWVTFNTTLH